MKTGRLLKFHRPGGDVHAYFYQEGDQVPVVLDGQDVGRIPVSELLP